MQKTYVQGQGTIPIAAGVKYAHDAGSHPCWSARSNVGEPQS